MGHNYGGVKDADASGNRNPYFLAGNYTVKIVKVREHTSRPPKNEDYYIIDAEILKSDVEELRVGTVCSQMIKISQDMGIINIKRFLLATNGLDPENKDNNEFIEESTVVNSVENGTENGRILDLRCYMTETQNKNEFTVHQWVAARSEDQDENPLLDLAALN